MAGVGSIDDLHINSTPTWKSFSELIMAEILENTPRETLIHIDSKAKNYTRNWENQKFLLTYQFEPPGKNGTYKIKINLTREGIEKISFFFEDVRETEWPKSSSTSLGSTLRLFYEIHEGARFYSMKIKKVNEANEGGAFTSYITCTPDGYIFRTSK